MKKYILMASFAMLFITPSHSQNVYRQPGQYYSQPMYLRPVYSRPVYVSTAYYVPSKKTAGVFLVVGGILGGISTGAYWYYYDQCNPCAYRYTVPSFAVSVTAIVVGSILIHESNNGTYSRTRGYGRRGSSRSWRKTFIEF